VIFFSRYEASQFGASQIEAEHILLGLIREDRDLTARFFRSAHADVESVRKEIEGRTVLRDRISSQIDLPLSNESKRVLSFAADESEKLGNRHIGTEHLLLGLLREENSIAAEVLYARGLEPSRIRKDLMRQVKVEQTTADRDERWMRELLEACIAAGLFTQGEFVTEFMSVAALRQFGADKEALLRMLAANGLADPQRLPNLAFDLRDEEKLAEFIDKLRQE
jgi:ATP-dependent Clp protease ATP-binding subunit ClpC